MHIEITLHGGQFGVIWVYRAGMPLLHTALFVQPRSKQVAFILVGFAICCRARDLWDAQGLPVIACGALAISGGATMACFDRMVRTKMSSWRISPSDSN
jgi:hypothetical protein